MQPFQENSTAGWLRELAAVDALSAGMPPSLEAVQKLRAHGRMEAAIEACRAVLGGGFRGPKAWRTLADLLTQSGRRAEAREALAEACRLDAEALDIAPEERAETAAYLLARETGEEPPAQAPAGYVRALFDRAAEEFDQRLVGRLGYQGPRLLAEAVTDRLGERATDLRILDAGCGTGLAAGYLRPLARQLDGVDLSPEMTEKARAREAYDGLHAGDLLDALAESEPYDLIFAADVFSYIGELSAVLEACSGGLEPGGLLAATVEAAGRADYVLGASGRYAHSPEYLERSLAEAQFDSAEIQPAVVRHEATVPVDSLLVTAVRAGTESPSRTR